MKNRINRILNHAPPTLAAAGTRLRRAARSLYRDERGQSTTEYILILSIVVMVAMKFKGAFVGKVSGITDQLVGDIANVSKVE